MDCQREEPRIDFLRCLNTDLSLLITSHLDGAGDLVRFCVVSRFWREYAIANGLAKQACWKLFPQLCNTVRRVDTNKGTNVATEWEILERDHKAYIGLLRAVARSNAFLKDCIESAISASSTDNPLNESIINTLNPRDRLSNGASYWSSKGQLDPQVPETLTYKIKDGIWSIVEVDVQPFEAFFQRGNPIYAAKSVRFRFGNPKPPRNEVGNGLNGLPEVEWTYTSPEFPMMQANYLQRFKLPLPVFCVGGGYMQIELLGRVQRHEMNGLYYLCVSHVRMLGRPPRIRWGETMLVVLIMVMESTAVMLIVIFDR